MNAQAKPYLLLHSHGGALGQYDTFADAREAQKRMGGDIVKRSTLKKASDKTTRKGQS